MTIKTVLQIGLGAILILFLLYVLHLRNSNKKLNEEISSLNSTIEMKEIEIKTLKTYSESREKAEKEKIAQLEELAKKEKIITKTIYKDCEVYETSNDGKKSVISGIGF